MGIDQHQPYLARVILDRESVPSFDEYPFCIPAVRNLHTLKLHPKVTFLIGDNGTGKSTLLEAIAVGFGFNAEGGSRNFNFSTRASHSELHQHLRLDRRHGPVKLRDGYFLRAESFFNVATEIENLGVDLLGSYGGIPLHEQSHGESFFSLLSNRLRGQGLYLFDEPEAALSPLRQLSALRIMHDLVGLHSQFIIVTHSPIIMAYPDAAIYLFSEDGITQVAYEQTEHYTVTKDFLNSPERTLKVLFSETQPR